MQLTNQSKLLLTVAVVLLLVYFLYKNQNDAVHNEGNLEYNNAESEESKVNVMIEEAEENGLPENISVESRSENSEYLEESDVINEMEQEYEERQQNAEMVHDENIRMEAEGRLRSISEESVEELPEEMEELGAEERNFSNKDYSPPESEYLQQKFNKRNKAGTAYKKSSYSGSSRGNLGDSSWDKFFDKHNNLIKDSHQSSNDDFGPIDETSGGFASFKNNKKEPCGSGKECSPEDLFNVDKMLPQEVNDDWFDVQPEPVSVKNSRLINVTKPIGVNTIGSSLRNASHDLRGPEECPKFTVSPWLQSSIEPDHNLRSGVF